MDEIAALSDPHAEIERIEERIEALTARIENCRKFIVASRLAIAFGLVILLAIMFGFIVFDPLAFSAAVAAVLGGIVLSGSNRSTAREAEAELAQAEMARAELIGRMNLRVVAGTDMLH